MKRSSYGWIVLLSFIVISSITNMLWLNFAPILSVIQEKYEISELQASSLILVFPIWYIILSIPAGLLIDKKGYRYVISVAAVATALSSIIRVFDSNFWMLFLGQTGIAIAQPFIMNGISKLVADWFDHKIRALATGIGTLGIFLGMAFSMALTPMMVHDTDIHTAMIVFAGIAIGGTVIFILLVREAGQATEPMAGSWKEIPELLGNRNLVVIYVISFLALGFFNGFTNWIELILKQRGINSEDAGLIAGVMIIGGILGSIIIPAISDKVRRRKPLLILCGAMATLLIYPMATSSQINLSMILGFLLGGLALPALALLLTMSEEEAGHQKAGAATGFLMLAGNAGTVLITVLMETVKNGDDWFNAIILLVFTILLATIIAFVTKETFRTKSKS